MKEVNCLRENESSWKGLNGIALWKLLITWFSSLRSSQENVSPRHRSTEEEELEMNFTSTSFEDYKMTVKKVLN